MGYCLAKSSFHSFLFCSRTSFTLYQRTRQGILYQAIITDLLSGKNPSNRKYNEKRIWTLLYLSLLDHFKRFKRFPSYSNIFISKKTGEMINRLLVAYLTEQECCTFPHITLVIF
jgi:hypothetical protein